MIPDRCIYLASGVISKIMQSRFYKIGLRLFINLAILYSSEFSYVITILNEE